MNHVFMNSSPARHTLPHRARESGVALIEFALVLPVLLLLIVGGIEITRFVLANQKVDKVANQMADFIAQVPEPSTVSASSPELTSTFQKLMSPFGTADAGFVVSVVNPSNPNDTTQPAEITSQSANNASSAIGGKGTKLNSDKDLGGIVLRSRDTLIIVEVSYKHSNVLGGLLDTLTKGGNAVNLNGRNLYKKAIYRYRLDIIKDKRDPADEDLGDKPGICGYYRDADVNHDGGVKDDDVDRGYYDIWPIGKDAPHPCQCYSEDQRDDLKQKLKTCRPQLLATPYNCPSRDGLDNTLNGQPIPDSYAEAEGKKVCCSSLPSGSAIKRCFGCIDDNDQYSPATSPGDADCPVPPAPEPPAPPGPPEPPAPPSPPEPPAPPAPPSPPPAPPPPFFGS